MINMIKIESIQLNHSKWPTGEGADYGFLINKKYGRFQVRCSELMSLLDCGHK